MTTAGLRDPPVPGWPATWLVHRQVQAEVGHQLLKQRESAGVTNVRGHRLNNMATVTLIPPHGHESFDHWIIHSDKGELTLDHRQLTAMEVDRAQQSFHALSSINGWVVDARPARPLLGEEVRVRADRHQVPLQDCMDLIFQLRPLLHQMSASSDQPGPRSIVGDPCIKGQKSAANSSARIRTSTVCESSPSLQRSLGCFMDSTPQPGPRAGATSPRSRRSS